MLLFLTKRSYRGFSGRDCRVRTKYKDIHGLILVTTDFNSKSPMWEEKRMDSRGKTVCELIVANDIVGLNNSGMPTFNRRGISASIIYITYWHHRGWLVGVREWKVLDEDTVSNHMYIQIDVQERNSTDRMVRNKKLAKGGLKEVAS